jgi:hypothetical protein
MIGPLVDQIVGTAFLLWLGGWGTVAFPGAHWYFWVAA